MFQPCLFSHVSLPAETSSARLKDQPALHLGSGKGEVAESSGDVLGSSTDESLPCSVSESGDSGQAGDKLSLPGPLFTPLHNEGR